MTVWLALLGWVLICAAFVTGWVCAVAFTEAKWEDDLFRLAGPPNEKEGA